MNIENFIEAELVACEEAALFRQRKTEPEAEALRTGVKRRLVLEVGFAAENVDTANKITIQEIGIRVVELDQLAALRNRKGCAQLEATAQEVSFGELNARHSIVQRREAGAQ